MTLIDEARKTSMLHYSSAEMGRKIFLVTLMNHNINAAGKKYNEKTTTFTCGIRLFQSKLRFTCRT